MPFLPSLLWSSILMPVSGSALCTLASEVTSQIPSALTKQLTVTFCFPFDVEGRLTRDTFLKQDRDNARSSFLVTSFLNSHKGLVENNPRLDAPQVVPHKSLECSRRCWLSTRSWLTRTNTDVFPENRHKPNCQIETLPLCWEGTPPLSKFYIFPELPVKLGDRLRQKQAL